ncbi:MAG: hypothetical protein RIG27_17940 [Coleofasciculus sp. F4-SAH-05]
MRRGKGEQGAGEAGEAGGDGGDGGAGKSVGGNHLNLMKLY